jgi:hypothetical protein
MPPPFTPMYAPVQVITGGGTNAGGGALRDGRSAASAEPAIVAVATEAIRSLRIIVVPLAWIEPLLSFVMRQDNRYAAKKIGGFRVSDTLLWGCGNESTPCLITRHK